MGRTTVLCTCCVEPKVPDFLVGKGKGWLTAEYGMLPGSTATRKPRDKGGKIDGRSVEIQRLIGRSLRAVVDLRQARRADAVDRLRRAGGRRRHPHREHQRGVRRRGRCAQRHQEDLPAGVGEILTDSVAAVSVGIVDSEERLDLEYVEDRDAEVDLNLVMTGSGKFIEVQGSGEEATFTRKQLDALIDLGETGVKTITAAQKKALSSGWPW